MISLHQDKFNGSSFLRKKIGGYRTWTQGILTVRQLCWPFRLAALVFNKWKHELHESLQAQGIENNGYLPSNAIVPQTWVLLALPRLDWPSSTVRTTSRGLRVKSFWTCFFWWLLCSSCSSHLFLRNETSCCHLCFLRFSLSLSLSHHFRALVSCFTAASYLLVLKYFRAPRKSLIIFFSASQLWREWLLSCQSKKQPIIMRGFATSFLRGTSFMVTVTSASYCQTTWSAN